MNTETNLNLMLTKTHENLLRGIITPKEAAYLMKDDMVSRAINSYINKDKVNSLVPYFPEDLQNIYMIILICQYIYNNSGVEPPISDETYDTLYEIMLDNGGNDVVSAPVLPNREVITHKYPTLRGSLDKVYYLYANETRTNPSRKYLDEWIRSAEDKIYKVLGKRVYLDEEEIYVFPKWDGVSGIEEFNENSELVRALTRGEVATNEACDITQMLKYCKRESPKYNFVHGIKTEIMMRDQDLEAYNKEYGTDYKQTRSIVASILNSKEIDDRAKYLVAKELRVQPEDGEEFLSDAVFKDPYIRCRLMDRDMIKQFSEKCHNINGLRCDGVVIYLINDTLRKALGRENHINKSEVAYKFTEEVKMSKIEDIEFQLGLFGSVTPVAKIKPVKMKGNTISSISLGSFARLNDLKLAKGDRVKVLYDIIPYLVFDDQCERSGNKPIEAPENCPDCNSKLSISDSGMTLSCKNPECPCREKGKILNFIYKMGIEEISYATVNDFYKEGFLRNIKDIYKLHKHYGEIVLMDGYGETKFNKIINQIDTHRNVTASKLLGAIGIDSIGEKTFNVVFEEYSFEELLDICKDGDIDKLTMLKGIKEKKATKIIVGVNEELDTLKYLMKKLDIYIPEYDSDSNEIKFTAYLTKVRDENINRFIEEHGGKVVDTFNKSTSMLIVPSKHMESAKIPKAEKYGIHVVQIDEVKDFILNMEYLENGIKEGLVDVSIGDIYKLSQEEIDKHINWIKHVKSK